MSKKYKINRKKFIRFLAALLVVIVGLAVIVSSVLKKKPQADPEPEPQGDQVRPEITLIGPSRITMIVGGQYSEYGCTAKDDVDGDLTDKVEIQSDINTKAAGEYHVSYIVSDAAGNMTRERRTVIVTSEGPLTQDVLSFDLNQFYADVICKETPYDEAKYDNLILFGDSFIEKLCERGYLYYKQCWSRPSISTEDIYTKTIQHAYVDVGETFFDVMDSQKPETVLILLNSDWTGRWNPEYLSQSCDAFYGKIKADYPDTRFIICSLMPVEYYYDTPQKVAETGFNRDDRINKMNVYMCELCRKYGFKFMNAAESVKNPATGACYDEYIYEPDGIHLSDAGCEVMLEYIKNHLDY